MNREWDRGKDNWNPEVNSWAPQDAHFRDEDYYGDNKRRKFNTGGYEAQTYDTTSYAQKLPTIATAVSGANANFGSRKRLQASEASPHVIFLGLDPDFTEADLQNYLSNYGCAIETVTIIRERSTGASKGFGFAQFPTTEHARAFVDPSFPFIQMPPPASHGATAMQAFYKALETGVPHNGRRVKIDYSQSASPNDKGRFNRGNPNDGTRDIGNSQHAVLLFRGLDPLSGPQAILQAMKSSAGVGKEGAIGMKRIILIKDRVTLASFGFAFVEFVDTPSAAVTFGNTMSTTIHPSGFRISDRPVAVSYAQPDSFQHIDPMMRDEASIASSFGLGGAEGAWVRYWDEASTIAVLEFKDAKSIQPESVAAPVKEKKEKKKKEVAVPKVSAPAAPSALPVSDKPVTLNFNKGPIKLAAATTLKPISLGFSSEDNTNAEDDADDAEGSKVTKRVAPPINSKKTASNISKWNQVQEELSHNTGAVSSTSALALTSNDDSSKPVVTTGTASIDVSVEEESEFSDVKAMSCLLCSRQFKTLDQLKRHNKESDLHKKNLTDTNLREVARQKVLAKRAANGPTDQPKYRDRASERRTLFNQPEVPLPEKETGPVGKGKKRQAEGPPRPPTPPAPAVNPGKDENNVGNKLLKMMGWQEGTGLGTSGEGRVEPIKTAIYAEGVGLGASKGKELEKYAEGFSNYVGMAQQAARDRYEA